MKWQLNTYIYLFRGYTASWAFSFIVFFIHDSIVSYPNAKEDKRCFKSSGLHIPHRLRDLLWMVRAWFSAAPTFSSRSSSSCEFSSQILLKAITFFWHTFLEWMNLTILGGHSKWPSPLLHSSLLHLPLQVVLDTLMTAWSLHSGSSHSSTGFFRSYSDFCSSLNSLKFWKTFNSFACNR